MSPAAQAGGAVLRQPGVSHAPRGLPGLQLHQLFEQRCDALAAQGLPGHLAVDGPAGSLSYAALDQAANRLAHQLRQQGVAAGQRVALLLDRSAQAYAAMLAVLKLGAAYVPLDAGFPAERVAFIVADAGCRWLLGQQRNAVLCQAAGVPVVLLDAPATVAAVALQPGHRPAPAVPADDLCYVIYTSGSTGRPKGVPIRHAQVVNFVLVAVETYGFRADDRVYQGLTLAFDFAVEELWVPLAVGATLLPNGSGVSLLGDDLQQFLLAQRASALCAVPTLLATLPAALPGLRLVITSGEACPRDLVSRWHAPGRRLLNAYGPTEATVTATLGLPEPGRPVTIGRPLPTYAIVVLVPGQAQVLPLGEVGEIGIAGLGVAQGYLNRPAQSQQAFIPDFIGIEHNPSGLIYRTGDLGRINSDGEVEYLGRIDTQVKLRGYRIELAEIETLLLQCPGVAQVVVNPWEAAPGQLELVAYYTLAPDAPPPSAADLQARLRRDLPAYMVPAWFQPLARMPMLASDKADRNALPAPSVPRAVQGPAAPQALPQPGLETQLAELLAPLVGQPVASAEAHFFNDLGASSLLMARYGSQVRSALGQGLPAMADLYAHPSVRQLAQWLQTQQALPPVAPPAQPVPPAAPDHTRAAWAPLACGTGQVLVLVALASLQLGLWWQAALWVQRLAQASGWALAWAGASGFAGAWLLLAWLLPVAAKWLLLGRCRAGVVPAWGWGHWRLWTSRLLVRASPMAWFAGTPLAVAGLRALGARVAWSAHVALPQWPAAPDLLHVGERCVLNATAVLDTATARQGAYHLGPVLLGDDVELGDASLVDIHTQLADGVRLGHTSTVCSGQRLTAGPWHGHPARPAPAGAVPAALQAPAPSLLRRWAWVLLHLALLVGLVLPLPLLLLAWLPTPTSTHGGLGSWAGWAGLALAGWAGALLLALASTLALPRMLEGLLPPGRVYTLYGLHHALLRLVRGAGNSRLFNELFGDSSAIVHYLQALGWRQPQRVQTGSNFGMAQQHDVARLCSVGSGSMVSDGLVMLNARFGAHGFTLAPVQVGPGSFLGNAIVLPAGAALGSHCLLASKVAVPLLGPLRQGVGLLGSPAFEIPRHAAADGRPDLAMTPERMAAGLPAKNRANARTALASLASQAVVAVLLALLWAPVGQWLHLPLFVLASALAVLAWRVGVDAAARGWRALQPQQCSIYTPAFWRHERYWKLGLAADHPLVAALAGTPLRAWLWRALGVPVGRGLLDDGAMLTERSLVRLGQGVTLGAQCTLQGHSLEDGVFKADRLVLGDGVSVGPRCYVHYGTRLEAGCSVAPDSFVMKGETLPAGSRWGGNPARPAA